jgi:hypothetical protein
MDRCVIEIKEGKEVFEIIADLKELNLFANIDYTFTYCPPDYDDSWQVKSPKQVILEFKNPKHTTFFKIKYAV